MQARKIHLYHDTTIAEQTDTATNLALKSSITSTITNMAKDRDNQKTFVKHRYTSEYSLGNLMDNVKVELLARHKLEAILSV